MQASLLIHTIGALKPEVRKRFLQFLKNPFYNHGNHARSLSKLYKILIKRIDLNEDGALKKQEVYNDLYPGRPYKNGHFSNLVSELMHLLRRFIAVEYMHKSWGEPFLLLATAYMYRRHNMNDQAYKTLQKAKKLLPSTDDVDLEKRAQLCFWVEKETTELEALENQTAEDLNMPGTFVALIEHFSREFLSFSLLLYQQKRVNDAFDFPWRDFIEIYRHALHQFDYFNSVPLRVINAAITLLEEKPKAPEVALQKFIALFNACESQLTPETQRMLAAYVRNFVLIYADNFDDLFRFEIYREHLEKGWLYQNEKLIPRTYLNIINLALKVENVNWLFQFLNSHTHKILSKEAKHFSLFGMCLFYFHLKNWEQVDELKQQIHALPKIGDKELDALTRLLDLKISYEQN